MRGITGTSHRGRLGGAFARTTALALAVFDALEQAWGGRVGLAVEGQRGRVSQVLVVLIEAELGLDGGAVDTELVKAVAGTLGELHVLFAAVCVDGELNLEVHAGDNLGVGELPDVNVVAADDAGQPLDVLSDVLDTNVLGGGLEQNARSGKGKRDRRLENNHGDEKRDGGISIELARPIGEPDDQSSDDDADIAEGIAEDVEHHGVHTHVSMVVAGGLASLLGECVVVASVDARVSATSVLGFVAVRLDGSGAVVALGALKEG